MMPSYLDLPTRTHIVLCGAIDYINVYGWTPSEYVDAETGQASILGALTQGATPGIATIVCPQQPNAQARMWIARAITGEEQPDVNAASWTILEWSREHGRTRDDVIRLLYTTLDLMLMLENL